MRTDKCQIISSAGFMCLASMASGAFIGFIAGGMIDSESTDAIHGDFRGPKIGAGVGAGLALIITLCALAGIALYQRRQNSNMLFADSAQNYQNYRATQAALQSQNAASGDLESPRPA